jgi:hypothetical protein
MYYTTDTARQWLPMNLPTSPNGLGIGLLSFHPSQSDWLIFTGWRNCDGDSTNCHSEAFYTLDHGRNWNSVETYVRTCTWARTSELRIDRQLILCESYRDKKGNQKSFNGENPLQFVEGAEFFKDKRKVFDNVVGFAKFSEYLLVAEVRVAGVDWVFSADLNARLLPRRARWIFKSLLTVKSLRWDSSRQGCQSITTYVTPHFIVSVFIDNACTGVYSPRVQYRLCVPTCHHARQAWCRVGQRSQVELQWHLLWPLAWRREPQLAGICGL